MFSHADEDKNAHLVNRIAVDKWIDNQLPTFGRFAYQLGVAVNDLPQVQQVCLHKLQKEQQWTVDQVEVRLYQLVIEQTKGMANEATSSDPQHVLGFQEDSELHLALQKLERDHQIAIVLFYFHEMSTSTRLQITGKTDEVYAAGVTDGLRELAQLANLNQLELKQRLSMLAKSYQRFVPPRPLAGKVEIVNSQQMVTESVANLPMRTASKKKSATILVVTSLFLATIIGVSFMMNKEPTQIIEQQSEMITKEKIAQWRSDYEAIKKESPQRLGMTSKQYEKLSYVKQADVEIEKFFSSEGDNSPETSPIVLQDTWDRLVLKIETPQGMVDALARVNPMLQKDVEEVLKDYAGKTDELRRFADQLLLKYKRETQSAWVMGQLSPEKLLTEATNYPEELRLVIEALPEYNLFVAPHPQKQHFRTVRDIGRISQQNQVNSSWEAFQYLDFIAKDPYFDETGFLFPLEEIPYHLSAMEQSIIGAQEESSLLDEVEVAYHQLFWQLLKGHEAAPVFNEQGQVKPEYRTAWNNIATSNPLSYLMLPILKEMEASNWTESQAYRELKFHSLEDAVAMEQSGELADRLPNGNLSLENEVVDLTNFDYRRIEDLYKAFAATHDLQLLAGVSPLDVFFMYHYANKLEDPETQWYLLADSPLKPTLQVYKKQWQKIPELTEKAKWVELSDQIFKQRVKEKVYIYPQLEMFNMEELDGRYDLLLVIDQKASWRIDYQLHQTRDLAGEDPSFLHTIEALYAKFDIDPQSKFLENTSPIEIAGLFLKAAEKNDIETMKKLTASPDEEDNFQAFIDMFQFQPFTDCRHLTFRTHFAPEEQVKNAGSVEVKYEDGSDGNKMNYHFMLDKTPNGWRMSKLFN